MINNFGLCNVLQVKPHFTTKFVCIFNSHNDEMTFEIRMLGPHYIQIDLDLHVSPSDSTICVRPLFWRTFESCLHKCTSPPDTTRAVAGTAVLCGQCVSFCVTVTHVWRVHGSDDIVGYCQLWEPEWALCCVVT